jgi:hypothetical protein
MEELPTDLGVRALVFGRSDSGKSTFALAYAISVLTENPAGGCLIFARRSKTERKLIEVQDVSISDRIYYRWIQDRVSLVEAACRLHEHANEPLELLIVEDILDFVLPSQVQAMLGYLVNGISVFPTARLVVTLTPRSDREHHFCLPPVTFCSTGFHCTFENIGTLRFGRAADVSVVECRD